MMTMANRDGLITATTMIMPKGLEGHSNNDKDDDNMTTTKMLPLPQTKRTTSAYTIHNLAAHLV
jgi:hypothetical protein